MRQALLGIDVVAGVVRQGDAQAEWEAGGPAVWVPSEGDLAAVAEINRAEAKSAGDGDAIPYVVAGFVLLMGSGHGQEWYDWAYSQGDVAQGTMTIEKGGVFSAGSFTVTGCPPAKQDLVEAAIGSFSDKSVTFA
jgi:hypothetical protein